MAQGFDRNGRPIATGHGAIDRNAVMAAQQANNPLANIFGGLGRSLGLAPPAPVPVQGPSQQPGLGTRGYGSRNLPDGGIAQNSAPPTGVGAVENMLAQGQGQLNQPIAPGMAERLGALNNAGRQQQGMMGNPAMIQNMLQQLQLRRGGPAPMQQSPMDARGINRGQGRQQLMARLPREVNLPNPIR